MAKWMAGFAAAAFLIAAGTAQAQPKTAAQPFNARKPADVASALTQAGATGVLETDKSGNLFFKGQQNELNFSVEFRDCSADKSSCKAAYYMASWEMDSPPLKTLNLWNDVTYVCAAFQAADGSPYLKMGFLPQTSDTRAGFIEDHDMWLQCVGEFRGLLADPDAFEASIAAPN